MYFPAGTDKFLNHTNSRGAVFITFVYLYLPHNSKHIHVTASYTTMWDIVTELTKLIAILPLFLQLASLPEEYSVSKIVEIVCKHIIWCSA